MFKNLLLVALVAVAILAFHSEAAPANSDIHSPHWEKVCQRRLRSFVLSVCLTMQCKNDVTKIGCERKLNEAEVKEICCPNY